MEALEIKLINIVNDLLEDKTCSERKLGVVWNIYETYVLETKNPDMWAYNKLIEKYDKKMGNKGVNKEYNYKGCQL